ncbi:hypothetical protein H0H81_002235 [Sphagnurus paluster]|uniref:Protein kinase domain-containing protein n=1 Tax=Sphagnurus paluster TaxID=117069 RepID=A0A9P7FTG0_9AGAR|nr:hypothetical protein H0H81_002235 [Sphagnurus paluster]
MVTDSHNISPLVFTKICMLGRGASGQVWKVTCDLEGTGGVVALKQSRVSTRVSRPLLQYEARIIKLLQGTKLWYLKKKNHTFSLHNVLVIGDQVVSNTTPKLAHSRQPSSSVVSSLLWHIYTATASSTATSSHRIWSFPLTEKESS